MNNPIRHILLLGLAGLSSSCMNHAPAAAQTTMAPVSAVDVRRFGPLPTNYEATILELLAKQNHLDSQNDHAFSNPAPGVVQDNGPTGLQNHYGWIVKLTATPRVKPTTYIGPHYLYFMFVEGHVGDVTDAFVRGFASFVDVAGERRANSL